MFFFCIFRIGILYFSFFRKQSFFSDLDNIPFPRRSQYYVKSRHPEPNLVTACSDVFNTCLDVSSVCGCACLGATFFFLFFQPSWLALVLLACFLDCFFCFLACLVLVLFVSFLLFGLLYCLLSSSLACFLPCLLACLLACLFSCLLACLLACFLACLPSLRAWRIRDSVRAA